MTTATPLQQLAESYHVQTSYEDDTGRCRESSPETLLAVLRVLGAHLERPEDAADALRAHQQALWQQVIEPVHVAWDGKVGDVLLRLPARSTKGSLGCRLELESGEIRAWSCGIADLTLAETARVEGDSYQVFRLPVHDTLTPGYHTLALDVHGTEARTLLLASPTQAFAPDRDPTWGVFLPLYAVRSAHNWGAGDFADLEALIEWTHQRGGGVVGTLPFLAGFLGEQPADATLFEPSPYSPASRLFWNEFYLDLERVPELASSERARELMAGADFQRERADLRAADLVDYRRVMILKRRVLEELARTFFTAPSARLDAFRQFVAGHRRADDYARFRATCEQHNASWYTWPERLREGNLQEGDYDEDARRYHLYVQWLTQEQLGAVAARARAAGRGLYLDLPLGVHGDSYDVWRERSSFALGVSAGAPPDIFFTRGQDWGFPPLHPKNIRTNGYRYLRDCLTHQMRFAGMLRIDHMMGLHRFYWVPHGLGAQQGAYVRYPAEEMYAVYTLESNRQRTMLAGEDLGTVPPEVRPAMLRHRIHRLYVAQYELQPEDQPFPPVPEGAIASVNTHDMPTFAAYWEALDVADRVAMELLDAKGAVAERERRKVIREAVRKVLHGAGCLGEQEDLATVLRACLAYLASTPAQVVLANLEDLWQATLPQNVPGTWRERPNWRRKAEHALEAFDEVPGLRETLWTLDRTLREARQ